MNKSEVEERIAVMQAWVDGKTIQLKMRNDAVWNDVDFNPNFDSSGTYRIKPEPEVIWVNKYDGGSIYAYSSEGEASSSAGHGSEFVAKKFIAAE